MAEYKKYEDTDFDVADGAVTLDLNTDIGGVQPVLVSCDKGEILIELEFNSSEGFGDQFSLKKGQKINFEKVLRVRLNSGENSSIYRVKAGLRNTLISDANRMSLLERVSLGMEDGYSFIQKFGENPDIDVGGYEDIWELGGDYIYPTLAATNYISSSDNSDTEEVTVIGLDSDWNVQTQNVTLQGQTKTEIGSGLTWIRVYRAYNNNGTDLAGDVYIYEDDTVTAGVPNTASKIKACISNGSNQTQMALYSVPAGKTGYLVSSHASLSKKKDGLSNVQVKTREFGKVFRVRDLYEVASAGTSAVEQKYDFWIEIPEKSDIKLVADSSVADSGIAGGFSILLKDT